MSERPKPDPLAGVTVIRTRRARYARRLACGHRVARRQLITAAARGSDRGRWMCSVDCAMATLRKVA